MPVICWAPMAQSAQDPTTIAQYIANKVLEHNVDANAHGLADYAIYNHRSDPVLDHVDYCINSQKITSDWIIGKKLSTNEGVGPGTDGVIMDSQGIMMYQSGSRKVNIPKSGTPEFEGIIIANQMSFTRFNVMPTFESFNNWYTNIEATGGGVTGIPGMADIASTDVAGKCSELVLRNNMSPLLNIAVRNPILQFSAFINDKSISDVGMGLGGYNPANSHAHIRFWWANHVQTMYAQRKGVSYPILQYALGWKWQSFPYQFKIEVSGNGRYMKFYIGGVLQRTIDTPGFSMTMRQEVVFANVNRAVGDISDLKITSVVYSRDFD